jgi:galactoside O-acetyltransferase
MELGGRYLTEVDLRNAGFRKLGRNVRIHTRASIYGAANISIGSNVRIDDFSTIIATGKLDIGNYVSIHNFCLLNAKYGIFMEDFVTLSPAVKIFTSSDDYLGKDLTGPTVPCEFAGGESGRIILGKHVIIGAGSVVLPGCKIGQGCAVGALSLVKKSLEPWGIYAGIPVNRIKNRKRNPLTLEKKLKAKV